MKPSQAAATSLLVPAGPPEPFDLQSAYASVAVAEANLPRAERRKADGSGGRGFRTGFFLFELKCNDQLQAVNHGCGPSRVPGTEHLELAVLVRESVDKGHAPGQRPALGGLAGQAALAGQMAARLSGHGALRHVSVEVVSTEFNQPEERKALQAAIEYAAQRGHALLLPAVSRLARDAKHIFEAVQRVTAAGGRVFVAVSAASLAAGPAGELLQRLVATAVAGRVGLGQTAATWRLGDRVLAVAASNPPRLQAVRELLAASLPDGVLVVCAARCSPTPDEDDNDSSLLRQLECAALVAGELRQTSMRLFGRDDGRSTTDSFDELPLKRRMDEAVAAELLKRTTSPAPMIVVLAWGFERLGRSIVQLRELAVYGAGLAIPVHLACCVPPRSLLDGLSPRRQIDVSLADAPSPPTLEMCTKLEALLAQPPSAGAPDLANLLPIFVGTKTLRLPKCAASPSARVLFLSRRSQPPPPLLQGRGVHGHGRGGQAAARRPRPLAERGGRRLPRVRLPRPQVQRAAGDEGRLAPRLLCRPRADGRAAGRSASGTAGAAPPHPADPRAEPASAHLRRRRPPQAAFGQVRFEVELLAANGMRVGLQNGLGTSVETQARNAARKGQFWACVRGCSYRSSKGSAAARFQTHFAESPQCAAAVRAILVDSSHPDHALWTSHKKWLEPPKPKERR